MAAKAGGKKKRVSPQGRRRKAAEGMGKALGAKIRKLRERKGWSQQMFAAGCRIHSHHLGKIERGEANVCLATLHELATRLGTTVASLLQGISSLSE